MTIGASNVETITRSHDRSHNRLSVFMNRAHIKNTFIQENIILNQIARRDIILNIGLLTLKDPKTAENLRYPIIISNRLFPRNVPYSTSFQRDNTNIAV